LFADVIDEVIKLDLFVMIKLDELPVAIANGGAGFPGGTVVMRVMPVERAAAGVIASELAQQALAVGMKLGLRWQSSEIEHGGKEIHADHRLVRHTARLSDTGGADDRGLAYATLVQPTFARAQRQIAAGTKAFAAACAETAVVAEENDHGVLVEL